MRFLRELFENVRLALTAVRSHVLRSSLTVLGILVGVFSIILVMTAIRVLQGNLERGMSQLGANTFQLQRFPAVQVQGDSALWKKYARRKRFYIDDTRRLAERATRATAVAVVSNLGAGEATSRYAHTNPNTPGLAMSPEAFITRNLAVASGRAFSSADEDAARRVCVLGSELATKLFPYASPLGETVKFKGGTYSVIGVLEAKGSIFGQSQDNFLAIPLETGLNRYGRDLSLQIQIQCDDAASVDPTVEQVRGILRALRKVNPGDEDDFEIISNDSVVSQFRDVTENLRIGSAVISSIALVAAGIGIMNIMLVSVTERTREIGIRRAIGAKKRSILAQFLCEAIVLSEIGGIIGVALGILAGNVLGLVLHAPPIIPYDWVLIGLGICSFIGIAFGTYPAWKAANLDPIESLRYE